MHQKDLARQAWLQAGLYRSRDPMIREFLKRVDECRMECWPELIEEVRTRYPEQMEKLAKPLWDSGDRLLRMNLIRLADPTRKEESSLLSKLVRIADPKRDALELRAIARQDDVRVLEEVARKKDLPPGLQRLVEERKRQLRPERSQEGK